MDRTTHRLARFSIGLALLTGLLAAPALTGCAAQGAGPTGPASMEADGEPAAAKDDGNKVLAGIGAVAGAVALGLLEGLAALAKGLSSCH